MTGTDASRQSPARAAAAAASRARWGNLLWLLPVLTLYAAGLLLPLGITVQRALELGSRRMERAVAQLAVHRCGAQHGNR
jgi:hypothetical protein